MRTLLIDIETSPNLAHVWSIWNVNVGLNQLLESTEMICFAAKWLGERKVMFFSDFHDGHEAMVLKAHELLDEADVIMHYNGKRFDVPHLNREFLSAGLTPPAPYKQIDLLNVVKKNFRYPSNKLAYISKALGLEGKVSHEGHELWIKCLAGDQKAWSRMRTYAKRDVALLEDMHKQLLPWIQGYPNLNLYHDTEACPRCGSDRIQKRGWAYTGISKFQQYACTACGGWFRGGKRESGADLRAA